MQKDHLQCVIGPFSVCLNATDSQDGANSTYFMYSGQLWQTVTMHHADLNKEKENLNLQSNFSCQRVEQIRKKLRI